MRSRSAIDATYGTTWARPWPGFVRPATRPHSAARARKAVGGRPSALRCGGRPCGPTALRCSLRGATSQTRARVRPSDMRSRRGVPLLPRSAALLGAAQARSQPPAHGLACSTERVRRARWSATAVSRRGVAGRRASRLCGAERRGPGSCASPRGRCGGRSTCARRAAQRSGQERCDEFDDGDERAAAARPRWGGAMSALRIERDGAVARVWLNRPEVRNAFNDDARSRELAPRFAALGARRRRARRSSSAAAARRSAPAPTSAGCATMAGYTWEQNRADAQALAEMLWTIYSCPVPVVGRIHGDCYAGGVGLASVCDVLVAADGGDLLPQRSAARPAAGDDQPVRRSARSASRRRAASSSPPSASARREAHALRLRRTRSAPPTRIDAKVDELGRDRSSPTGRWRRAPASSSSRTSPAAPITPSCAPRPRAGSPTSAPAPKAAKACRASSEAQAGLARAGRLTS